MDWIKKFLCSRINIIAYGSVAALAIFYGVFGVTTGAGGGFNSHAAAYYASVLGSSLRYLLVGAAYFVAILLIFLVLINQIGNFATLAHRKGAPTLLGGKSFKDAMRRTGRTIGKALLAMVPAFLLVLLMSFLLDRLNAFDRARLIDGTMLGFERSVFGGYAFFALGMIPYPAWLINFIIFSFENMTTILVITAFILAYYNLRLLRELVASFCLTMLLMAPLWLAFPVLSPQDRFADNVYRLPVAAQIASIVTAYRPDAPIANFLAMVRHNKRNLPDMPTSTLPSAHAAWAVLAGYYLFRAKKWLGFVALPFLIASTAGTVILAQHYFLDIPAGIAIATLAIYLTRLFASREMRDESPSVAGL